MAGRSYKIGKNTQFILKFETLKMKHVKKQVGMHQPTLACTQHQQTQSYAGSQNPVTPDNTATVNDPADFVSGIDPDVASCAKLLAIPNRDPNNLPLTLYTAGEITTMEQSVEEHHSKSQSAQIDAKDHIIRIKEQIRRAP
ncbi:MAG: hypothetical protein ABF545_02710 [Bifidobacterium psychraerophilum]|uniref:hypothetical protein n=1 Tax=Bifidobacterium psychraerophilum TaxID=218140 RepID=UPI0039E958E1